jgi:hypothetical protein
MKIVGIAFFVVAVLGTGLWGYFDRSHRRWAFILFAMVALCSGCFLMMYERVFEMSFKDLVTIKAVTQQATTDAETIANLKKRVEAQSEAVDSVANSAREARKLGDELSEKIKTTDIKLTQIDQATRNVQTALEKTEQIITFASVLLAAQNDDWHALDRLLQWANDANFPLRELAENGYMTIALSHLSVVKEAWAEVPWRQGVDPAHLSISELEKVYSALSPIYHAGIVRVVWKRSDIPKKERMEFLILVLKTSNSVSAKYCAARFFVEATGDEDLRPKFLLVPLPVEPLSKWWEAHKDSIKEPNK